MAFTPEHAQHLRDTMVETQLRQRGIWNTRVLEAMHTVPREHFAHFSSMEEAYGDHAYGIACEQTISQPFIVAEMTQALSLSTEHTVLEIGTGSGYQTAILAQLVHSVHTMERHKPLSQSAQKVLRTQGYSNIQFHISNGVSGLPEHAPFDRILVTACAPHFPKTLLAQLTPGGIAVLPVQHTNGKQHLMKVTSHEGGTFTKESLGLVRFVPLINQP